ncbi:MAG: penicillin-binding transpeptidase domain-containing protein [Saprospiraceae bacterium]
MNISAQRQRNIQLVFLLSAAALIAKVAHLQLFDDSFRKRADATTIDKLTVYPPRGLVYDRHDRLIINNEAMYDLMVTYNQVDLKSMNILKFCRLLGITEEEFYLRLKKDWRSGKYSRSVPFVFDKKLSIEKYALLQESLYEFPGFFVQVRNIRGYPYHAGAHVLGYINEVDPRDIERSNGEYESGDYIGAAGLESEYEAYLRGVKGHTSLLKDNLGRIVGKYMNGAYDVPAIPGHDLTSSIDIDLQTYGERLMQNKTGSIVAIEPKTGQILCMISAPTYDPNLLAMTQGRGAIFSQLLTDSLKPFFDRTVMAKYPPGSIFKTVVSLVGLQEGTLSPGHGVSCNGGYFYAGRLYKCHHHSHVGNVVDAIAYSCNTYYFNEFRNVVDKFGFSNPHKGLDIFADYCNQLGLGVQLGIDYPNENKGNIPDAKYYDKIYKKELGGWRSPTIMSVGIGQGEIQLTTLQMANLAACIANKGYWYSPHLAKEFRDRTPIPDRFYKTRGPDRLAVFQYGAGRHGRVCQSRYGACSAGARHTGVRQDRYQPEPARRGPFRIFCLRAKSQSEDRHRRVCRECGLGRVLCGAHCRPDDRKTAQRHHIGGTPAAGRAHDQRQPDLALQKADAGTGAGKTAFRVRSLPTRTIFPAMCPTSRRSSAPPPAKTAGENAERCFA